MFTCIMCNAAVEITSITKYTHKQQENKKNRSSVGLLCIKESLASQLALNL